MRKDLVVGLGLSLCGAAMGVTPAAAQATSPALLEEIGIDQRLGAQLPLDLVFRDEEGRPVRLGDFFGEDPVLLVLAYYECPMLCGEVLDGLVRTVRALSFDAGKEYRILTISFDPHDGPELAAAKKRTYLRIYDRPGSEAGWRFLTGSTESIDALTEAVGFRYVSDASSGQYAHASGLMVLTPAGKVSRYFYGIEFPARDLRLGLIEASAENIGSPVDELLLYCYQYDPTTGRYGLVIMNVLRLAGIATVVGLAAFVGIALRRERRHGRS